MSRLMNLDSEALGQVLDCPQDTSYASAHHLRLSFCWDVTFSFTYVSALHSHKIEQGPRRHQLLLSTYHKPSTLHYLILQVQGEVIKPERDEPCWGSPKRRWEPQCHTPPSLSCLTSSHAPGLSTACPLMKKTWPLFFGRWIHARTD